MGILWATINFIAFGAIIFAGLCAFANNHPRSRGAALFDGCGRLLGRTIDGAIELGMTIKTSTGWKVQVFLSCVFIVMIAGFVLAFGFGYGYIGLLAYCILFIMCLGRKPAG